MAAAVVADHPEVLGELRHLQVPHMQVGAERVRQHQHRRAFAAVDLHIDRTAIGVDRGHERSPFFYWTTPYATALLPPSLEPVSNLPHQGLRQLPKWAVERAHVRSHAHLRQRAGARCHAACPRRAEAPQHPQHFFCHRKEPGDAGAARLERTRQGRRPLDRQSHLDAFRPTRPARQSRCRRKGDQPHPG